MTRQPIALVVTSDIDLLTQAHLRLEADGYEVVVADDLATATSMATAHRPALALLDRTSPPGAAAELRGAGVDRVESLHTRSATVLPVAYVGDWVQIGTLRLNPENGEAEVGSNPVTLSAMEFDVLEILLYAEGTPIPTPELARRLGGADPAAVERTVVGLAGVLADARTEVLVAITADGAALAAGME